MRVWGTQMRKDCGEGVFPTAAVNDTYGGFGRENRARSAGCRMTPVRAISPLAAGGARRAADAAPGQTGPGLAAG